MTTVDRGARISAALADAAYWNSPADPPAPTPIYPGPDYCPACGLSFHHWPGCPNIGDGLPTLP